MGPKLKIQDIPALQAQIRANPEYFIVQRYTALSQLGDKIVDLRLISQVATDGVIVANTPWGRGLPTSGSGKVNLSGDGREITVMVDDPRAAMCCWIFLEYFKSALNLA